VFHPLLEPRQEVHEGVREVEVDLLPHDLLPSTMYPAILAEYIINHFL
jgi:hypothetical protein